MGLISGNAAVGIAGAMREPKGAACGVEKADTGRRAVAAKLKVAGRRQKNARFSQAKD